MSFRHAKCRFGLLSSPNGWHLVSWDDGMAEFLDAGWEESAKRNHHLHRWRRKQSYLPGFWLEGNSEDEET